MSCVCGGAGGRVGKGRIRALQPGGVFRSIVLAVLNFGRPRMRTNPHPPRLRPQSYTDSADNVRVGGGVLTITALQVGRRLQVESAVPHSSCIALAALLAQAVPLFCCFCSALPLSCLPARSPACPFTPLGPAHPPAPGRQRRLHQRAHQQQVPRRFLPRLLAGRRHHFCGGACGGSREAARPRPRPLARLLDDALRLSLRRLGGQRGGAAEAGTPAVGKRGRGEGGPSVGGTHRAASRRSSAAQLATDVPAPPPPQIDIMESVNAMDTITQGLHYGGTGARQNGCQVPRSSR